MRDPENGLEQVYHSVRKNIEYSLVVVPPRTDFSIKYHKPSIEADLTLTPQDIAYWRAFGVVD